MRALPLWTADGLPPLPASEARPAAAPAAPPRAKAAPKKRPAAKPNAPATPEPAPGGAAGGRRALRIKVALRNVRPPVWRRLVVDADLSLTRLHHVLQAAMGWHDAHLYEFRVGRTRYGRPDPMLGDVRSSDRATLWDLLPRAGAKAVYVYDFGDDWVHDLVLEEVVPLTDDQPLATCLTGKRACPPEDCGGPWGYARLLTALSDPAHPDHGELRDWAGDVDPERFDLGGVNARLAKLRGGKRRR